MQYTYTELAAFLLFYGFLGWALEVAYYAVKERRFCNRGFFNLPICPEYGVMMDILIILLPTMGQRPVLQFLACAAVVSVVEYFAGGLAGQIWKKRLWSYERRTLFGGKKKDFILALAKAAVVMAAALLLHPLVFWLFSLIPELILRIVCIVLGVLLLGDFGSILYAVHRSHSYEELEEVRRRKSREQQSAQMGLGSRIYHVIWNRLNRAYPQIEQAKAEGEGLPYVFARGICLDKLIWVFVICAFAGDLIETVFCRVTAGVWMSRSSVIYGAFSIVWGLGAVILTVVLHRIAQREDRYIFLAGCLLGGVYEYLCSVFTEVVFGTVFWDYSKIPFNIGGRINLLYCIFWGLLSVVWIKLCYPALSRFIEKLPVLGAKIATWAIIVLMACDALISAAALGRYEERRQGKAADTAVGTFLDVNYPDDRLEKVWPNMISVDDK
ncbi:MAG: putative ABC transporter permease [Eubacteriales bacterium]|nr:putative ABC transporter permease [Eubacteriales bacterium]